MKRFVNAKRFISVASIAGLIISGMPGYPAKAQEMQTAEKSYVVLATDFTSAKEVAEEFDGEKVDTNKKIVEVEMTRQEAKELQKEKEIIYVEDNITLTASAENTEEAAMEEVETLNLEAKQWNRDAVGVSADSTADGTDIKKEVKIEILDSGVAATTDLCAEQYTDLSRDITDGEFNPMFADDNGHGTAMASVIAAAENEEGIAGINPDAQIYSVKALDSENTSPLSRIVEGIYWGIEHDMDIINMSFGTSVNSEILHKAVRDAYNHGILLVAAAGNTQHREIQYPAAYEEVIAVGSADEAGKLSEDTSIGTELELLAPGENVVSEDVFSVLTMVSGTSVATAQVSAVASLLMQNHPGKDADFIRALLKQSARKIKSEESGSVGLVDYKYAEEIYDDFADNYTKTDMTEIESDNDNPVVDYSKKAEEMVEGLWSKEKHANLLEVSNNFGISTHQFNIIKQAAPWADEIDNKYKHSDNSPSRQLHGKANYVAHAQYLWYLAYYLGSSSTGASPSNLSTLNDKINKAKAKAKAKMPAAIVKTDDFQNLYAGTGELLKYEYNLDLNRTIPTSRKLQLFALGYLSHLLSDTYSHRTIVPPTVKYISGSAHDNKNLLGKDFRYEDLNIKDGSCEFRWLADSAFDKDVVSINYIDNPMFYSNRYANAQHSIAKELRRALKDEEESYTYQLFIQKPEYEANSKLSRLKTYAKACGGNMSAFSASEWAKYSTND